MIYLVAIIAVALLFGGAVAWRLTLWAGGLFIGFWAVMLFISWLYTFEDKAPAYVAPRAYVAPPPAPVSPESLAKITHVKARAAFLEENDQLFRMFDDAAVASWFGRGEFSRTVSLERLVFRAISDAGFDLDEILERNHHVKGGYNYMKQSVQRSKVELQLRGEWPPKLGDERDEEPETAAAIVDDVESFTAPPEAPQEWTVEPPQEVAEPAAPKRYTYDYSYQAPAPVVAQKPVAKVVKFKKAAPPIWEH